MRDSRAGSDRASTDDSASLPLLRELTRALIAERGDLAPRLADAVRAEVPFYRDPVEITDQDLLDSCRDQLAYLLGDQDSFGPAQIAAIRARQRIPLSVLFEAFRAASHFLWGELLEFARLSRLASDAQLVALASETWAMNESFFHDIDVAYRDEQLAMALESERERFAYAYAVLIGGETTTATLWEAVDILGLPRTGERVVVAVGATSPGRTPLPSIERDLAARRVSSAWILLSDVQLGLVSLAGVGAAETLRTTLESAEVTAGISPPYADYADSVQATRFARTALAASSPSQVTAFADSPIGMVAAGSPDVSDRVVSTVLGEVMSLPEPERLLLLSTVDAWFESGGSVVQTARRMYVHPNTVRNRLRKVEELTGRTLADPRASAEVYLALSSLQQSVVRRS